MRIKPTELRGRCIGLGAFALVAISLAACSGAPSASRSSTTTTSANPALVVPSTVQGRCSSGGACLLHVPYRLRDRPLRLPAVAGGGSCPASTGTTVTHPGMGGVALGGGVVTVITSQAGDLAHGIVDLATSNVVGWYGIKTDWAISPSYSGWVIVRAKQLNGVGLIAALGDATVGPVVIPPGPTLNTFAGWGEQPSGTYVKGPGCYGGQVDGSSFSEEIVIDAVLSPDS